MAGWPALLPLLTSSQQPGNMRRSAGWLGAAQHLTHLHGNVRAVCGLQQHLHTRCEASQLHYSRERDRYHEPTPRAKCDHCIGNAEHGVDCDGRGCRRDGWYLSEVPAHRPCSAQALGGGCCCVSWRDKLEQAIVCTSPGGKGLPLQRASTARAGFQVTGTPSRRAHCQVTASLRE